MNVKELIEILQRMPENAPVLMRDDQNIPLKLLGAGESHGVVHLMPTLWVRPSIVLAEHRDTIVATLANFGFTDPRVFGSVLLGTDSELSDLDLLVDPGDTATLFNLAGASLALRESLGVRIDLRTPGDLPEKFRDQVLSEAKSL